MASLPALMLVVSVFMAACSAVPSANNSSGWIASHLLLPSGRLTPFPALLSQGYCTSPRPEHTLSARFASGIRLDGYYIDDTVLAARLLVVTLYWTATTDVHKDYKVFVHVLGSDGAVASQDDARPVGGARPTNTWAAGSTVQDPHFIVLSAYHRPGWCNVEVGLYQEDTGQRLALLDDQPMGSPDGLLLPQRLEVLPAQFLPKLTSH